MNRDQVLIVGVCAAACALLWIMSEKKQPRTPPRDVTPPEPESEPAPEPVAAVATVVEPVEAKP